MHRKKNADRKFDFRAIFSTENFHHKNFHVKLLRNLLHYLGEVKIILELQKIVENFNLPV